nr:putative mitochondrial processing peptidase [Ipomoea trifida]
MILQLKSSLLLHMDGTSPIAEDIGGQEHEHGLWLYWNPIYRHWMLSTQSKRKGIEQGNTSTSKEPRTTTVEPGQERLKQQPTEQAQQPHREKIEEEQPAQADKVDNPEQTPPGQMMIAFR